MATETQKSLGKFKRARAPEDSPRPFRLWNPFTKVNYRWRYYSSVRRAHIAALIEARWAKPDTVIEVYDARNGHLHGQYKRLLSTVAFMK